MIKAIFLQYIRSIIFGLEDSLVSTLGAVTGIAIGTHDKFIIILSGIVIIFVEALSMSAGTYLSSKSAEEVSEFEHKAKNAPFHEHADEKPVSNALVMAAVYLIGGIVPLIPYFFLPIDSALVISVAATSLFLFGIGSGKGLVLGIKWLKSGLEMLVVSGLAALLGFLISKAVTYLYGVMII